MFGIDLSLWNAFRVWPGLLLYGESGPCGRNFLSLPLAQHRSHMPEDLKIDRRTLLKTAVSAGAAAAAPAVLAADANAVRWSEVHDVVIAGAGGAGLAAAVMAGSISKDVVVLEKTQDVGGNTRLADAFNAVDPAVQKPLGIEDSPELHARQMLETGRWCADPKLVETVAPSTAPRSPCASTARSAALPSPRGPKCSTDTAASSPASTPRARSRAASTAQTTWAATPSPTSSRSDALRVKTLCKSRLREIQSSYRIHATAFSLAPPIVYNPRPA